MDLLQSARPFIQRRHFRPRNLGLAAGFWLSGAHAPGRYCSVSVEGPGAKAL